VGQRVRVEEVECRAVGARDCKFLIAK